MSVCVCVCVCVRACACVCACVTTDPTISLSIHPLFVFTHSLTEEALEDEDARELGAEVPRQDHGGVVVPGKKKCVCVCVMCVCV